MFRSGYVALIGVPNVGKSTLLNQLLGEKLSIVTPKPQTTRHRILGILNRDQAQILFLDTPGIHPSQKVLNEKIVETALASLQDADVVCHLIFPDRPLGEQDQVIARRIQTLQKTHLVLLNQVDRVAKDTLLPLMAQVESAWAPQAIIPLSALTGEGCEGLPALIEKYLPEGPAYYPQDQYTDHSTRFLCAEIVREKAMKFLHQEIPYGLVTQVEKFEEEEKKARIHVTVIVAKASHKGMVIGKQGQMLKRIGRSAREDIEKMIGKKVFLELFVKVVEGWSGDEKRLREFGIE